MILSLKYSKEGSLRLECISAKVYRNLVSTLLRPLVGKAQGSSISGLKAPSFGQAAQYWKVSLVAWEGFDQPRPFWRRVGN